MRGELRPKRGFRVYRIGVRSEYICQINAEEAMAVKIRLGYLQIRRRGRRGLSLLRREGLGEEEGV